MPPLTSTDWILAAVAFAICGVISLGIAAWLIRELAKMSAQEDVPQVLTALSGLLDKLSLFMPWSRRGPQSLPAGMPRDRTADHTGSVEDLSGGRPQ